MERGPLACDAFSSGGLSGFKFPRAGLRFVMFHDGQMCTSNMPLDGNFGDAHIISNFGVGVTGSVRKIDFPCPWILGFQ
jgi:hypothetical protein